MGSLYGTGFLRNGRLRFAVNYRLRHLRSAIAPGELDQLYKAMRVSGARYRSQLALLQELVSFDAFVRWARKLRRY